MDNLQVKKFISGPKIIFIILGLIVLGELVYAARVLTFPTPVPPPQVRKTTSQNTLSRISLNIPKTTFSVSEAVPVSIIIDTGNRQVSGADVTVKFDPQVLEASKESLVQGKIFSEYPTMSVDARKGIVYISGIGNLKSGFEGTGQFALINFKAKSTGKTSLSIDFKKGSTTTSNLVGSSLSTNILDTVDNIEVTIQ